MTNIITKEGRRLLQEEYDFFWEKERPKVVREVSDAAEGEKNSYQLRLLEIDARLEHLKSRMKVLKVAPHPPAEPEIVFVGCWVTYEDQDGSEYCYQLVGPDEIYCFNDRISIDSALGKALSGRRVDDEILVKQTNSDIMVVILNISGTGSAK